MFKTVLLAAFSLALGYSIAYLQLNSDKPTPTSNLAGQTNLPVEQSDSISFSDFFQSNHIEDSKSALQLEAVEQLPTEKTAATDWQTSVEEYEQGNSSYLDLLKLVASIAQSSPEEQQAFILANLSDEKSHNLKMTTGLLLNSFSEQHPELAIGLLDIMPKEQRADFGRNVLVSLSRTEPEFAWDWLKSADTEATGDFLSKRNSAFAVSSVLRQAAKNPELQQDVYQFAASSNLLSRNYVNYTQRKIAALMAEEDVYAVLDKALNNDTIDSILFESAVQKISENDATEAAELILDNEDIASSRTVNQVSKQYIEQGKQSDLTEFYDAIQDARLKDNVAVNLVSELAEQDLEQAGVWLARIEDSRKKANAGVDIIQSARQQSYHSLSHEIDFIKDNFQGKRSAQVNLYVNAYKYWSKTDQDSALKAINNIPDDDGKIRDQVKRRLKIRE
ncbi:hypothetical protein [Catenovulum maritimum]|uniref:Uncharacterized protein n=1 Tax=Catenovulum maritimum TaxID=1513271 RepID=A0A0J8GNY2_9ALTE|nr:hypothetical protein [Catenovulum maritimum]KMT64497.1 hypothetical protein XM47_13620 [Catenovulum maritimum]